MKKEETTLLQCLIGPATYCGWIDTTDREIDSLVYELYGLTEEEIKIVEAS